MIERLFPLDSLRTFRDDQPGKKADELTALFQSSPRQDITEVQDSSAVLDGRAFSKVSPQLPIPELIPVDENINPLNLASLLMCLMPIQDSKNSQHRVTLSDISCSIITPSRSMQQHVKYLYVRMVSIYDGLRPKNCSVNSQSTQDRPFSPGRMALKGYKATICMIGLK